MRITLRSRSILTSLLMSAVLLAWLDVAVAAQTGASSRPAIPSAGCGTSSIEPGRHTGESGFPWILALPDAHDGATPVPLVVNVHGGWESASHSYSRFASAGLAEGFAVVAPDHDRDGYWMVWVEQEILDATPENPDTVRIGALLDDLGQRLCLDLARVYVAGFSGGAIGTTLLGCAIDERVAAIALVGIGALGPDVPCPREAPLPVISVYGTSDEIVLKDGGLWQGFLDNLEPSGVRTGDTPIHRADAFDIGLPVMDRVDALAVRNGCVSGPGEKRVGQAEHYVWTCPEGADTEFIAHRGGHDWYSVSDGRSTEELIWEFFEQHPLPE